MIKRIIMCIIVFLFFLLAVTAFYHTNKKMPNNLSFKSSMYEVDSRDLSFIYDLTYTDESGEKKYEQNIFDTIFSYINNAQEYILIDMFLFNPHTAKDSNVYRSLSSELTEALLQKKKEKPEIKIDFLTDPINIVYKGGESKELKALKEAGINVIVSDLRKLRDSNYIYSSIWRTFIQWFGNSEDAKTIKHPFNSEEKVSLRSYLELVNFKANHRKVFVSDSKETMVSIVTSANPHDGSSAHSNVALLVKGDLWKSIYQSESAVAEMSGGKLSEINIQDTNRENEDFDSSVVLLTEKQIKNSILEQIKNSKNNDEIMIAQFYFADRDIVKSLVKASGRGVDIKLVLDPNKDAFGYEKNGIPNRQVAQELVKKSENKIKLRWYSTHGEQFHSKLFVHKNNEKLIAILGSANLTRRNLDDYNLETDVRIETLNKNEIAKNITDYFERIWNNQEGYFTVNVENYQDKSLFKRFLYIVQEKSGLSTF